MLFISDSANDTRITVRFNVLLIALSSGDLFQQILLNITPMLVLSGNGVTLMSVLLIKSKLL